MSKIYLLIMDHGLNGFDIHGVYRESVDTQEKYLEWCDSLTKANKMHPYELGYTQWEIDTEALTVEEI